MQSSAARQTASGSAAAGSFDARAFRDALGYFATGVAIITTSGPDGRPAGLTCNSFGSVSLDPPLVLWNLRRESELLPVFRKAGHYAIHVLGEDQRALSARFASREPNRFAGVPYTLGRHGSPLIGACSVRFECTHYQAHELGDHVMFVGRVELFEQARPGPALVFHRGAYCTLARGC